MNIIQKMTVDRLIRLHWQSRFFINFKTKRCRYFKKLDHFDKFLPGFYKPRKEKTSKKFALVLVQ